MTFFSELQWRGLVQDSTDGLEALLAKEKVLLYAGFDPTAPSLHVGSLLPLMTLARAQVFGHKSIGLLGGTTGLIGDPSGKGAERPLLALEEASSNTQAIRKQVAHFLGLTSEADTLIVDNADWLASLSLVEFLRDTGKYFTVSTMLAKDSVKRRLVQEQGITFTEFAYMLLQAFDFWHLYERYGCILQIGGSDQWGNITAGLDMIRRKSGASAHGLVMPLVMAADGKKFGKTVDGAVWLDANSTSPYNFYQFWLNRDDREVVTYLKYFTWLTQDEISELEQTTRQSPEGRQAQRVLAREVTRIVHGAQSVETAERATRALFATDLSQVAATDILTAFADMPSTTIPRARFETGELTLCDVLLTTGLAESKSDAKRAIKAGGVYLNSQRVTDERHVLVLARSIDGRLFVLRKGPKQYHVVMVTEDA